MLQKLTPRVRAALAVAFSLTLVVGCTPDGGNGSPDEPGQTTEKTSPDRPEAPVPDVQPEGFVDAPGGGLQGYLDQELTWQPCEFDAKFECTTVSAPLDYDDPDQQALTLNLLKVKATAEPRLGTIFVNPGGPGSEGTSLAVGFKRDGLEQYDIVGWDPRGTGDSTPVQCMQGDEMDAFTAIDSSPDDDQEMTALIDASREFGQSCLDESGELLQNISTQDTVRDLDMLRQLVGDEKLHYLGYSYGTELGASYAEMFPENVGHLVLDAAANITDDDTVIQAQGFDRAFTNFTNWCVERDDCAELGSTSEEVTATLHQVLGDLDQNPIQAGDREVTQSLGVTGVVVTLYAEETWDYLRQALIGAKNGDGRLLLFLADSYNQRAADGNYGTLMHAFPAIRCLDEGDEGIDAAKTKAEEQEGKAPIFGRYFGPDFTCATWPVAPVEPLEKITGDGAAPIVVVGTTGDSATPYEFAESMAEQLDSGVLLTLEGEGHGAYGGTSSCIDQAVVKYFVDDEVPADGTTCQPD